MAEIAYTARFELPHIIERGRDNRLTLSLYRDGAIVAPSAIDSVTLYNGAGESQAVATSAIVSSAAQADFSTAQLGPLTYGDGYFIDWSLTMPDGVTHSYQNDAIIVFKRLVSTVSDIDLIDRLGSIDGSVRGSLTSAANHQRKLDAAWNMIQLRMIERGRRPWLSISPSSLREVHICLTLALIMEDVSSRNNPAYEERAKSYRSQYEEAWARVNWVETTTEGHMDTAARKGMPSGFWLGSRPGGRL